MSVGIHPHPLLSVMYFKQFTPSNTPEVQINSTSYYESHTEYEVSAAMDCIFLQAELVTSHDFFEATHKPRRLMTLPVADTRPAHLLILKDLDGYLHKGVSVFVKWLCQESISREEVIPPEITPIFDLKPLVDPTQLPVFALPIQKSYIFFGASTHAIHVMKVTEFATMVNIYVYSGITTASKTRFHYVSVKGEQEVDYDYDRPEFPTCSAIIIWNAWGIHYPSFKETFRKLYVAYSLVAFVLTETRACEGMLDFVRFQLQGAYHIDLYGLEKAFGGAALIWHKWYSYPWTLGAFEIGHEMGVSIQPGWKDNTNRYDYDNWYHDSGFDVDPSVHEFPERKDTPSPKRISCDDDY